MSRGAKRAAVFILLIIGITWAFSLFTQIDRTGPRSQPGNPAKKTREPAASGKAAMRKFPEAELAIERALKALAGNQGNPAAALATLQGELLAQSPEEATAAIRRFLDSGRDAPAGGEFEIGDGGSLTAAPTLRVFLLDLLSKIDPQAAAAASRTVLNTKSSADEWAIAMRNIARQDPSASGFLAGKMGEMLSYEPWRKAPSAGYLEAFDVVVHTKAVNLLPQLLELSDGSGPELSQAARVAVDRLAAADPASVLSYLSANPAVLSEHPFLRADFYAKADLGNPVQRSLVETHLTAPGVKQDEKEKLVAALAQDTEFVSENLLTPPANLDLGEKRLETLRKVSAEWIKDPRFAPLKAAILDAIAP